MRLWAGIGDGTGRRAVVWAAALATLTASSAATAQGYRRGGHGEGPGYVVAESRYGKGSVEGAVRHGPRGREVQLPGGNWIACERSCSETLRRATVDFWESNGPQSKDQGPGYFHWKFNLW
jgi:hypothetical protein